MLRDPVFLYVEDEPMSRTVMQMLLTRGLGYKNLTIMADSYDFQRRLQELPIVPDVVFLDIHVPPHDGFEMLKMVRDQAGFENTRVIALTASVMNEEVSMLRAAGFDGGIAKPIDQIVFPDLVADVLAGKTVWNIT